MNTRIKELGRDVKSKLESGLIITDATQCVLELVENALDAKCTAVAVRINLKNFAIEVVDNGMGISPDDLNLIGERYMTSKCQNCDDIEKNMETFGYRGQALASILDVCTQLCIKTKSEFSNKTLVKVFIKGRSPSVNVLSKEKCASGTTVTVCGFMSTMPVRQKRITEILDMREIRNQLEYLALIHNEVCFTLRDENKGEIIFESRNRGNGELSFVDLYGMALGKFLIPLNYAQQKMEIQGFIGLRRHFEDNLQFFYVNKRIISKSITHKVVNSLIDRYINESQTLTEESPIAGVNFYGNKNCYNVFLVQIRCPYTDFLIFRNLRKATVEFKNWDHIFYSLKSAVKAAFDDENSHVGSRHIIEKRKNIKRSILSKKNEMELGQLKYGIRGVFVKRKQCQLALSNKEAIPKRTKFNRKTVMNPTGECSLSDVIKNNSSGKHEMVGHLATNRNEIKRIPREHEPRTPPHVQTKNLELEQYFSGVRGSESAARDISIEFAAWLKSKINHDILIRKIYREFVEQKLTRKLKTVPQKRNQGVGNERTYEEKKFVYERKKSLKTRKTSVSLSRLKSNEKNTEPAPQLINKKVNRVKKDDKLHFQSKNKEIYDETVSNAFANDSVKIGSYTRFTGVIRTDFKRDTTGSKICSPQRDSSKSWTSHKNRPYLNKKYSGCSTKISRIFSDETEARELKFSQETSGKQKAFENITCLSLFGENIFKRLSPSTVPNSGFPSQCFIPKQSCKEAQMWTNTTAVRCDKGIQINLQELNDPFNVYRCATSEMGENEDRGGILSGKIIENDAIEAKEEIIKVLSPELETNFSGSGKNKNPSLSLNSASENPNPLAVLEELIKSRDLEASKNICETNEKYSAHEEKLGDEPVRRNSTADFHRAETISGYSLNDADSPQPQSDKYKNWEHLFVCEDTLSRNLPDTLPVGDEERINYGNGPRIFSCMERYSFIPKGLSPTVLERSFNKFDSRNKNISERVYKASDRAPKEKSCGLITKSLLPDDCIDELKEKTLENMIYYESEVIKSTMTKTESKICASLNSFAVEKDILSNMKVIGQWDKKFIVVKTCPMLPKEKYLLIVFDQHAVDERIRLEKLLKDSRNIDGKFISVKCSPPVKCKLEESTLRLIPALQTVLLNFGVKVSVVDSEYALLLEIPIFLNEDNAGEAVMFLKNLVKDVVEEFSITRGSSSTLPAAIYSKLSAKACKGAVKFNDALSADKMAKMINNLVACQSPFHCAHGRPSAVPVLDLEAFQNQVEEDEHLKMKPLPLSSERRR